MSYSWLEEPLRSAPRADPRYLASSDPATTQQQPSQREGYGAPATGCHGSAVDPRLMVCHSADAAGRGWRLSVPKRDGAAGSALATDCQESGAVSHVLDRTSLLGQTL